MDEEGARINFNYNTSTSDSASGSDKSDRTPFFNEDFVMFPFWKTNMYSHIIGIDDELWYIVEEGVQFQNMDEEGVVNIANWKLFTAEQKKQFKKHHKVKSILTKSISHSEFLKIFNKSSVKFIWDSLCSTYEGNEQVHEAKANLLVHRYELFKMKEDEDIETMFARFQTLVSGLQVLKKSYTVPDHVRKILRSLPVKWRPKITVFQEAKNLKDVTLESLISSLRSHEMELQVDEPAMKIKYVALSSTKIPFKTLKAKEVELGEEETTEDGSDEEMTLMIRRFQQWARKNNNFSNRSSGSRSSSSKDKKEEQLRCYNCNKTGHFIADCPESSLKDKGI
ncbi:serine/threonine protein kinase SRPK1 [Trifolium medium]|uniref:Serine/threonine protein kinase SRPK1 n=1 Tax=Trifolium medium TaxID=97028 RepID=A0A392MR42_9FABA|nr:serine/threonine protein kinase SRPK1 [Trifolium medium]